MTTARTLAEKVWDDHLVVKGEDGTPDLIYIDLHLVHEVTSPQAFDGLRMAGRPVRRLDLTIATEDHNTPTLDIDKPIADLTSRTQIQTLRNNAEEFGIRLHSLGDIEQGIVHVVGPQLGLTMPGIVSPSCGPTTWTIPCSLSPSECRRTPNSSAFRRRVSICVRLVRSAIGLSICRVGVLWSSVAIVRSSRRTGRPSARRPSKACGLVTSCTRCRSM